MQARKTKSLKKSLLLILGIGLQFISPAQSTDTMSIYFESNEWQIPAIHQKRLLRIPQRIFINDLDSVAFIGMADSVGSLHNNLILGKKRAKETAKFCKDFFTTNPILRIKSEGEINSSYSWKSRRVDIIFYSQAKPAKEEAIVIEEQFCLKRADSLLHRSHIHQVLYKRKDYISIETLSPVKNSNYYSARTLLTKTGKDSFLIYKLRWHRSKVNNQSASSYDYFTRILKADFEKFSIFTIMIKDTDSMPCINCSQLKNNYLEDNKQFRKKCLQVDRFLMEHLDAKRAWINPYSRLIRIPKSLVDTSQAYYTGCNMNSTVEWRDIANNRKWQRRKKNTLWQKIIGKIFKKHREKEQRGPYYYANIPYINKCMKQISRTFDCCRENPEPSECDNCYGGGRRKGGGGDGNLGPCCIPYSIIDPIIETGFIRSKNSNHYYGAIGFDFNIYEYYNSNYNQHQMTRGRFSIGLMDSSMLYMNLQFRNTPFRIPLYKQANKWSVLDNVKQPSYWLDISFGLDFHYLEISEKKYKAVRSAVTEINLYKNYGYLKSSLFINGGISHQSISKNDFSFYPSIRFGLNFRI